MSKRGKIRRAQIDLRHRAGIGSDLELADMRGLLRARLFISEGKGGEAGRICDTLEGMGLTRDDMFETLTETVFKGDEKTVDIDTKLKAAITREMTRRSTKEIKARKSDEGEEEMEDPEDFVDSDDEVDMSLLL
jgi:hypothetical protein